MSKKLGDLSLSKTVDELRKYPFGTKKHEEVRKHLIKKVYKKYPNQFILSTYNKFNTSVDDSEKSLSLLNRVTTFEKENVNDYLSDKLTLFEDERYFFSPREIAEYNFEIKQINVFGYITDGEKYILLKRVDKSSKEVTMIGGHIDFSEEAYQMSQQELVRMNMIKELTEEIAHSEFIKVPKSPHLLINTFDRFHDIFHMAYIYRIVVDNAEKVFESLETGEPHKHVVVLFESKEELKNNQSNHHWIDTIVDYM